MRHSRQAFTLIELLICTTLVTILAGTIASIIGAVRNSADNAERLSQANANAARILTAWRGDVASASRIDISDDNQAMTITGFNAEGKTRIVRYAPASRNRLTRIEGTSATPLPPPDQSVVLAPDVQEVTFAAQDNGTVEIAWNFVIDDGLKRLRRPVRALAIPLVRQETQP